MEGLYLLFLFIYIFIGDSGWVLAFVLLANGFLLGAKYFAFGAIAMFAWWFPQHKKTVAFWIQVALGNNPKRDNDDSARMG
jgi:hypothetical protein